MRQGEPLVTDRRAWLNGAIRNSTLGVLVVVSGFLATRRSGRSCPGLSTPCDTCGLFRGCELPRRRGCGILESRRGKGNG